MLRQGFLLDEILGAEGPLPKAPDRDRDVRTGGWNTDGHAGTILQAGINDGRRGRVQAQEAGRCGSRPAAERRFVQARRGMGRKKAPGFDPNIARDR